MYKYKKIIITILISTICASVLFVFLYHFDNKYTYDSKQPVNGIIKIQKYDIEKYMFLIYDWEFYSNKLYTPYDFKNGKPDTFMEYVSIGEKTHMSSNESSFESGTYRLNLFLPEKEETYAILLPEIYNSYNLYINDDLELKMGDIYRNESEIQSRMVIFKASGQTQILLSVKNNSHYYSGIVYPPAFGTPKTLNTMRGINILILVIVFMCTFICFIVSIYMNLILKQTKLNIFTIITFTFSIYVGQDILRYFFSFSSEFIYIALLLTWYMLYMFIIIIHNKMCLINKIINAITILFSVFICFIAVLLVIFSADMSVLLRELISNILGFYKWFLGIYFIITSVIFLKYNQHNYFSLLFGNVFFAVSLIFDRIYTIYEPIYGNWFIEISSFVLIICIGIIQCSKIADAIIFKLTFYEEQRQMKKQIEIHKNHYEELSKNIENTRRSYHDMRHYLKIMRNFIENKNYSALSDYINTFEKNIYIAAPISYCKNITIDALFNYYSQLCAKNNILFYVKFETEPIISFSDTDITILFGNLLENAFEACKRQKDENKFINIKGSCINDNLFINISNSFDTKIKMTNNKFFSSKRQEEGIGIKSINSIVEKYDGVIDFEINNIFSVFINIVVNT